MKVLFTIKEYAKLKALSEIAIRKQVSKNYTKSIKLDDIMYIIHEDDRLEKAKQTIKNKNSQIRELKLKLEVSQEQNSDKYLQELERQNKKLEKQLKQERKYNKKIHRDIFSTLANQKLLN